MNESTKPKRAYASTQREAAAAVTRAAVLDTAKALFAAHGIDAVTIGQLAATAGVSPSTVYVLFKSKEGVLAALMEGALFGGRYAAAAARLDQIADVVEQLATTATIARAIYESEADELGLMRGVSAFSPVLRELEQTFEDTRYALQEARIRRLYAEGRAKAGLPLDDARRILWMYTSREIYRMLVQEGGWTPDAYEAWLARTIAEALVERPRAR